MKGFTTKAVHGVPIKKDVHGSLRMPVYDTVSFGFDSSQDLALAFEGRKMAHTYSRITNPTVEDFEQRVRLLADSSSVIAVSSGMAAISNVILAIAESGSNIVTTRFLFGNTLSLFEKTLKDWGLETRCVDMNSAEAIEKAINDKTRALFFEVITNPQLEVVDVEMIVSIAHKHHVPVILDGTLTTPYLFKSKDFAVDIEVISSTKYISGGATSVGGVLIDNGIFDWSHNPRLTKDTKKFGPFTLQMRLRREVFRNLGSCLSPHNAFLQSVGLETLALRVERSCRNALAIAQFLKKHPKVTSVNYPGLADSPFHANAKKQFGNKFGSLLTFSLSTKEECFQFMDRLEIVRRATNLNDNKTLILHPASTIFCEYSAEEREAMEVGDTLMRLSLGIEDTEDILDDLEKGLEKI